MRGITFRAWDQRHKEMVIIDDLFWFEENGVHSSEEAKVTSGDYIFMQYTGFKDAGGEEFYGGDIFEDDAEWYRIEWWQDYGQWQCVPIRHNPLESDNIALSEYAGSSTCKIRLSSRQDCGLKYGIRFC